MADNNKIKLGVGVLDTDNIDPAQDIALSTYSPDTPNFAPISLRGIDPRYGDSKYDEDVISSSLFDPKFLDRHRAYNQHGWDEAGNFLMQSAAIIVGDTLEGVGYLTDPATWGNFFKKTTFDTGNFLAELGRDIQEGAREEFQIYVDPETGAFNPLSREWWFNAGPSIVSTLSLLIPSNLAMKGLSLIGKLLKVGGSVKKLMQGSAIGRALLKNGNAIGQAVLSRHMESMMEASSVWESNYQAALEKGVGDKAARDAASIAATSVYRRNWLMLAQDIPQYMMLNRAFSKMANANINSYKVRRAAGDNMAKAFLKGRWNITKDIFSEGLEEGYQHVIAEEGNYKADLALDPTNTSSFPSRFVDYIRDGEMHTAMFMGAIGAGFMQTAGKYINDYIGKSRGVRAKVEDAAVKDMESWAFRYSAARNRYQQLLEQTGDKSLATKLAYDDMLVDMGLRSIQNGIFDSFKDFTKAIMTPTQETLSTFGISVEDASDLADPDVDAVNADIDRLQEIFTKNQTAFENGELKKAEQVYMKTRVDFMTSKLEDYKKQAQEASDNLKVDDGGITEFNNLSESGRSIEDKQLELKHTKNLIKLQSKILKEYKKIKDNNNDDISQANLLMQLAGLGYLSDRMQEIEDELDELKKSRSAEDKAADNKNVKGRGTYRYNEYSSSKGRELGLDLEIYKNSILEREVREHIEESFRDPSPKQDPTEDDSDLNSKFAEGDIIETIDENGNYVLARVVNTKVENKEDPDKEGEPTPLIEVELLDPDTKQPISITNEDGTVTKTKVISPTNYFLVEDEYDQEDTIEVDPIEENSIPLNEEEIEPMTTGEKVPLVYSRGNKQKIEIFDEDFAAMATNPDTDFSKLTTYLNIHGSSIADHKKIIDLWKNKLKISELTSDDIKKILPTLIKGLDGKLSKDEIKEFLNQEFSGRKLYDILPIQGIVTKGRGKNYKVLASDLVIYKARKENPEESLFRFKVLTNLLSGHVALTKGLVRTNSGEFIRTNDLQNIDEALDVDPNDIILAVGEEELVDEETGEKNYIARTSKNALAPGTPRLGSGNIGVVTNKTSDRKPRVARVFPQKISKEHAEIIWDALKIWYRPASEGGGSAARWPKDDPRVQGDLTVGEIVSLLINFGKKNTKVVAAEDPNDPNSKRIREFDLSDNLLDKQLWIEQGILFFGAGAYLKNENAFFMNPKKKVTGKDGITQMVPDTATDAENKAKFIEWITTHKNYKVILDNHSKKAVKNKNKILVKLNDTLSRKFKIGNLESDGKLTYAGFLTKHGLVKTTLRKVENMDTVTRYPIVSIDPNSLEFHPRANTSKGVATKKKNPKKQAVEETRATIKVNSGGNIIKNFKTLVELPNNTELFIETEDGPLAIGVISKTSHAHVILLKDQTDSSIGSVVDLNKDDDVSKFLKEYTGDKPLYSIKADVSDTVPAEELSEKIDLDNKTLRVSPAAVKPSIPVDGASEESIVLSPEELTKGHVDPETGEPIDPQAFLEEIKNSISGEAKQAAKEQAAKEKPDLKPSSNVGDVFGLKLPDKAKEKTKDMPVDTDRKTPPDLSNIKEEDDIPPFRHTSNNYSKPQDLKKEVHGWLEQTLGKKVKVTLVDRFIRVASDGSLAMGQFTKDAIILAKLAETGTVYHEAFHRVSLLYLSPKERLRIYNNARSKYKLNNKSDREVEEYLAEKFRESVIERQTAEDIYAEYKKYNSEDQYAEAMYNKEGGLRSILAIKTDLQRAIELVESIKPKSGVIGWLQELLDFIFTFIFGKQRVKVFEATDLFDRIHRRKFKYQRVNKKSLKELESKAPYQRTVKYNIVFNHFDSVREMNAMTQSLIYRLFQASNIDEITDIENIDFNALIEQVRRAKDEFAKANSEQLRQYSNMYREVLADLESPTSAFKQMIKDRLSQLDIVFGGATRVSKELIEYEIDENDHIDESEEEGITADSRVAGIEQYSAHSFERKDTKNALASVKFKVATLTASDKPNPLTYTREFVDFHEAWYNVLYYCRDKQTIDEIIESLRSNSNIYYFSELADYLQNKATDLFKAQFLASVRQHPNDYLNVVFKKEGRGKNTRPEFHLSRADINLARSRYITEWNSALYMGSMVNRPEDDTPTINKQEWNRVKKEFISLSGKISKEASKNSLFASEKFPEYVDSFVALFNEIGVGIDHRTFVHMLSSRYDANNLENSLLQFVEDSETRDFFARYMNAIPRKVESTKIVKTKTGERLEPRLNVASVYSNYEFVRNLAAYHAQSHQDEIGDNILGPMNKSFYRYSLHTQLSQKLLRMRSNDSELDDILTSLYGKNSNWAKEIKSLSDRSGVKLITFSGFFTPGKGSAGMDYKNIEIIDDYALKLHMYLGGVIPLPTMAGRSTYWGIDGLTVESDVFVKSDTNLDIRDTILDKVYGYYIDELERINYNNKLVEEYLKETDIQAKTVLHNNLIENYHFNRRSKKDKNGFFTKDAFKGMQSSKFQHFPEFNNTKKYSKDDLNNKEFIKNEIRKSLDARIEEELTNAIDMGFIKLNDNGKYSSSFISDTHLEDYNNLYGSYHDAIKGIIGMYTVNSIISTIETEKMFSGDPAFFKGDRTEGNETTQDRIKRLTGLGSPGTMLADTVDSWGPDLLSTTYNSAILNTQEIPSLDYDNLYEAYHRVVKSRLIEEGKNEIVGEITEEDLIKIEREADKKATEIADNNLSGYKSLDTTDGQAFISPSMYRSISIRIGEWSSKKEKAYNLLLSNKKLTVDQEQQLLNIFLQPLKTITYSNIKRGDLLIPEYDKMSMAVLFTRMFKDPSDKNAPRLDIEDLIDRMEATGKYSGLSKIHMMKFNTVAKSGAYDGHDFYANPEDREGIYDMTNMHYKEQKFSDLRRQMVTDPHEETTTSIGSQFIKMVQTNIKLDKQYGDTRGSELISIINSTLSELSTIGRQELSSKFGFNESLQTINSKKFARFMRDEARRAKLPSTLIDAFTVDENGKMYLNIDSFPNREWIQSRILSLITKYVIQRELPGKPLVQMSNFGVKRVGTKNELKFVKLKEGGKTITAMECNVTISMFKDLIPPELKTFAEQVKYLKDNKLDRIAAYRIPTQGFNSMVVLKVKNFLHPSVGDTIMLPSEFTRLTGSDFDIDKLYTIRHNYETVGGKLVKVDPNGRSKEALENRLLDSFIKVLASENTFEESVTPLDTMKAKLKGMIGNIGANEYKPSSNFSNATPSFQNKIKFDNLINKSGVSIFALAKANHPIAQQIGLTYNDDALGLIRLDGERGIDDELISEWLSLMITAFVDIETDNFITKLNTNVHTFKVAEFLLRSGHGIGSFYFLNQPIIRQYVKILRYSKSNIVLLSAKDEVQELKKRYASLHDKIKPMDKNEFDALVVTEYDSLLDNPERLSANMRINDEVDIEVAIDSLGSVEEKSKFIIQQIASLIMFEHLESKSSQDLFNFVMACQVDTSKFGNNITEVLTFIDKITKIKKSGKFNMSALSQIFPDRDSLLDYDKSFLYNYIINGIHYSLDLMSSMTLLSSNVFNNMLSDIMKIGSQNQYSKKQISNLSKELFSAIVSKFFTEELGVTSEWLKDAMFGKNNIPSIIHTLRTDQLKPIEERQFPELSNNEILKYLYPVFNEGSINIGDGVSYIPAYIKTIISRLSDNIDSEMLMISWEELLNSPHDAIRDFAKTLFIYSYYTSGFKKKTYSFFENMPPSLIKNIGYDEFIKNTLWMFNNRPEEAYEKYKDIVDEFYRNNRGITGLFYEYRPNKKGNYNGLHIVEKDSDGAYQSLSVKGSNKDLIKKEVTVYKNGSERTVPLFRPYMIYEGVTFKNVGTYLKDKEWYGVYVPMKPKSYQYYGFNLREYYLDDSLVVDDNISEIAYTEEQMDSFLSEKYKYGYYPISDLIDSESRVVEPSTFEYKGDPQLSLFTTAEQGPIVSNTVNIAISNKEFAKLSNLSITYQHFSIQDWLEGWKEDPDRIRMIYDTLEKTHKFRGFNSVEQAFQTLKFFYTEQTEEDIQTLNEILTAGNKTGLIKKLGNRGYKTLDTDVWDVNAMYIMEDLLWKKFSLNSELKDLLLSTFPKKLTHNIEGYAPDKWTKLLPELMEGVRKDLRYESDVNYRHYNIGKLHMIPDTIVDIDTLDMLYEHAKEDSETTMEEFKNIIDALNRC